MRRKLGIFLAADATRIDLCTQTAALGGASYGSAQHDFSRAHALQRARGLGCRFRRFDWPSYARRGRLPLGGASAYFR